MKSLQANVVFAVLTQRLNSVPCRKLSTILTDKLTDCTVKSPFPAVAIPEANFYNHVFQHFPKYGKKTALIDGVTGREYSYNEVQESVVNMASGLVRSGMQKGDALALVSPNSVEFCTTFFSTLAMGGIMSTCNPNYTSEELAYQFKNSNSKYVATIPSLLPTVQEAASKAGCVEKVIVLGDDGSVGEGKNMISYQSLVNDSGSKFPHYLKLDPKGDTAVILYSSGTTGYPKGVKMSHYNLSSNLTQLTYPSILGTIHQTATLLAVIPFFHIGGIMTTLTSGLYKGSTIVTLPQFSPEKFLHFTSQYHVNCVHLVPPLVMFLARHTMIDKYDLSSLKHITYGAAPTAHKVASTMKRRLNLLTLQHSYGMSEIGISHFMPLEEFKPNSVGIPLPSVKCKVMDLESGLAVGPDCHGELVIQGPQVCALSHN